MQINKEEEVNKNSKVKSKKMISTFDPVYLFGFLPLKLRGSLDDLVMAQA